MPILTFNGDAPCPHEDPNGKCTLSSTCQSPRIPTRIWDDGSLDHTTAVLCVGEGPGYEEDRRGKSWIGLTGKFLHRILRAANLADFADLYLTNACRCSPPDRGAPSTTQVRMCQDNLVVDLRRLCEHYEQVFVLCLGRWAAYAAGHKRLKDAFSVQGLNIDWAPDLSLPTFYTYHPAALFPGRSHGNRQAKGRDPSRMRAVTDHLQLFWEVLSGKRVPPGSIPYPDRSVPPPTEIPREVVLDIETYGILNGFTQTVFHPRQAELVDGIPRGQQIVLVSLAWLDPFGQEKTTVFVWQDAADRQIFYRWLSALSSVGATILGKTIPFDIKFLRYNDVTCRYFLTVAGTLALDDLDIINHLDYELRPEKSLKPLSELLGIARYGALEVRADQPNRKAKSPYDPNLWKYGAMDAVATLRGKHLLMSRIADRYGAGSPKLSETCRRLRSEKLWSVVYMGENGMPLDWARLNELHDQFSARMAYIARLAADRYGLLLAEGVKGNMKSQRQAMFRALLDPENPEVDLIDSTQVQLTEKTRDIGIKDENINLALKTLSRSGASVGSDLHHNPWRAPIVLLRAYRLAAYKVQHFTRKLRANPRRGICEVRSTGTKRIGMVYPSWWVVPSFHKSGSDDEGGGTIQGRPTCTAPPLQTFPSWAKALYASSFPEGVLLSGDEKTLELRVAYLLSGDPFLGDIFARGGDPHTEVAQMLFPDIATDHPLWRSVYRQVGKRCNFLVIYGGGASKFYASLQQDIGHLVDVATEFPMDRVEAVIDRLQNHVYRTHFEWRKEQVVMAGHQGYLEIPTGTSRTFSGGPAVVASTYANECSNFPVQTLAAELVMSAQYAIQRILVQRHLRTLIRLNTYDSVTLDCPPAEVDEVKSLIHDPLTRPKLLAIMEDSQGRSVPLQYDLEVRT